MVPLVPFLVKGYPPRQAKGRTHHIQRRGHLTSPRLSATVTSNVSIRGTTAPIAAPKRSAGASGKLLSAVPPNLMDGRALGPRHMQVLDGLETIVLTEGFKDLTVASLARRLRCSRRTLYELADTKEAMVLMVIDRLMRRLARRAHDAAATEDTHLAKLRAFLIRGLTELYRATVSFAEDAAEDEAAHNLMLSHIRYATGVVADMIAAGIEAGEFAEIHPQVAAEVLDAGLARLQDPAVLRTAGVSLAKGLEEYLTLYTDGIRAYGRQREIRG
jgi:AcrR family transcriptional regulator